MPPRWQSSETPSKRIPRQTSLPPSLTRMSSLPLPSQEVKDISAPSFTQPGGKSNSSLPLPVLKLTSSLPRPSRRDKSGPSLLSFYSPSSPSSKATVKKMSLLPLPSPSSSASSNPSKSSTNSRRNGSQPRKSLPPTSCASDDSSRRASSTKPRPTSLNLTNRTEHQTSLRSPFQLTNTFVLEKASLVPLYK